MKDLTPYQQQAHDLRQTGLKFKEIAKIMKHKPDQIRTWCAIARRKLGLPHEHF